MNEKIFQNIFDKLQEVIPESWEELVFFAGYTEGSYSMKYYVDCGEGQYIDCFNQPGVSKPQLIKLFMDIDKVISAERKNISEDKNWTVFTMIVDSQGNMKTEFDYADISETFIAYENEWKKKYL